jgi:hypothetical protein
MEAREFVLIVEQIAQLQSRNPLSNDYSFYSL